jgi:type VI secretion system secreted protein Hcp
MGGAVDYFLKIDGVDGESADEKHKGEIDVLSWGWSASQSGTMQYGGGGGAGKVQMQDFTFTMRMCKASPKLVLACASGEHIKTATMTARKAGKSQQEYLKLTFTDILVSSYSTGGTGDGDVVPIDSIALNFAKIEFEYKEQKADGTLGGAIKTHWDLKANKGG